MKEQISLIHDFLVIEGNIGAGKTSLAKAINEEFGCRLILERFEDNSFLPKFYEDPARYAFPLEMSFLADRYQQLKDELFKPDLFNPGIVSDYIVDKSLIFSRKTLSDDEYVLYKRLFDIVHASLPKPNLLVYLYKSIPNLMHNIHERARDYERNIQPEYLGRIHSSYMDFIKSRADFPVLVIDCDKIDFVHKAIDKQWLFEVINKEYPRQINFAFPLGAEDVGRIMESYGNDKLL